MKKNNIESAILDPLWISHTLGNLYIMDGVKSKHWKISYYPIFENGKTGEVYEEPRALIETPMSNGGIDFREMPLRYLEKCFETEFEKKLDPYIKHIQNKLKGRLCSDGSNQKLSIDSELSLDIVASLLMDLVENKYKID